MTASAAPDKPLSELIFRPFRPEDGASMRRLHTRAILELAEKAYGPELAASWAHGLTDEGYAVAAAHGETFEIAQVGADVVGFCGTKRNEIYGLYVDPDFGRRGIGRTLLARAERRLRAKGYGELVLNASLFAVPFYRRCGYREIERAKHATRGGAQIDTLDMLKPAATPDADIVWFHNISYANRLTAAPPSGLDERAASVGHSPSVDIAPSRDIAMLLRILAALRDKERGCPWDIAQSFETIAAYTIEEAYEVTDAIARRDFAALVDELGDLLLQVVFHAQMAAEEGRFDFGDVVSFITTKMIRRHPHVFGPEAGRMPVEAVNAAWARIKAEEKAALAAARGGAPAPGLPPETSVFASVKSGLSPMQRAVALQAAAAKVGFDWANPVAVVDKLAEELGELRVVLASGAPGPIRDELGDALFVLANIARLCDIDPESAILSTNAKFMRRFRHVETALEARGMNVKDVSLDAMEHLWQEAKAQGL